MTSRPKWIPEKDKNHQRSLEERLDHLTTTVEAQQNILDRFIALYESEKLMTLSQGEDNEKQKTDAIVAKDTEIVKMRREIFNMKLAMERQTAIYVHDKMTWEQERDQLQKELEHYKSLLQRAPIDNSSTQITLSPPLDAPKLQFTTKDLTKTHKCTDCNEFSTDKDGIKAAAEISSFSMTSNLKPSPVPASAPDQKQDEFLTPSNEAEVEEEAEMILCMIMMESLIKKFKGNLDLTAEKKQTAEQQLKQDVVSSVKDESEIVEVGTALTKESTPTPAAAKPPTTDPITDNERRNLRQRFHELLRRHPCNDNSACLIVAFRGYAEHASECHNGPDCSWDICKRVQTMTEHRKVCENKLVCKLCKIYICLNDYKMLGMVRVLEKGCPLNRNGVDEMSEFSSEDVILMVTWLAVTYGLVGDNEKPDEDNEDEIPGVDVMTVSSCSQFSSSSSESSADEEETSAEVESSDGEKTSDEWEIVEAERRREVD